MSDDHNKRVEAWVLGGLRSRQAMVDASARDEFIAQQMEYLVDMEGLCDRKLGGDTVVGFILKAWFRLAFWEYARTRAEWYVDLLVHVEGVVEREAKKLEGLRG